MVQMQGGNDVDYHGMISTGCQRGRFAVIGRSRIQVIFQDPRGAVAAKAGPPL